MILKVANETEDGKVELLEFSPTMKNSDLVGRIVDGAIILRPLESTDEEGIYLWEKDIVEFKYEINDENKKYIGYIEYEQCRWIIVCNDIPDSYIELTDLVESIDLCTWVNVKRVGNKYTHPNLLKEYED